LIPRIIHRINHQADALQPVPRETRHIKANAGAPMISQPQQETPTTIVGTLDGDGAGDHDLPYRFGRKPSVNQPFPFSTREYAKLLILRSRVQAARSA
jgi:hypothetical protein